MLPAIDPIWIFSICVFGAILAFSDAAISLFSTAAEYRTQVNRRLALQDGAASRTDAIVDLRRERGLSVEGGYDLPVIWINRLIVQSGLRNAVQKIFVAALAGCAGFAALGFVFLGLVWAIVLAPLGAALVPLAWLKLLRRRRINKFTEQFSEALDIIVRSLRAGHPVPAAIRLAAREMADPVGTEFGMAEDEMTFGLDIETAMRNMAERVGQEDLPLFVASIAVQNASGGNLTEILESLSTVMRLRAKMRRKVRALSAEGRMSAIILSSVPIAIFAIVNVMSPDFYGKHWHDPVMQYGLAGAGIWMLMGNLWMRSMINFRI